MPCVDLLFFIIPTPSQMHHPQRSPIVDVDKTFNSSQHLQTRPAGEHRWAHSAQRRVRRLCLALEPDFLQDLPH